MRKSTAITLSLVLMLLWVPAAFGQDTVDSIEKALVAQWDKVNSLSADLGIVADFSMAPEMPKTHVTGSGSALYLKKDGMPLSRVEISVNLTETMRLVGFLGIFDGKDAYLITELLGSRQAKKVAAGPDSGVVPPGGKGLMDALNANFVVSARPPASLNGKDVYVLDAVPKNLQLEVPVSKLRLYFGKDSGILLKAVAADMQGVVLGSLTTTNIKINEPINESRFKYAPSA